MTVIAADCIVPAGELLPDFFGSNTTTYITGFIAVAEGVVSDVGISDADDIDDATAIYVYHLANKAKAQQLATNPATLGSGKTSIAWSQAQIARLDEIAAGFLARFQDLATGEPDGGIPTTHYVKRHVAF